MSPFSIFFLNLLSDYTGDAQGLFPVLLIIDLFLAMLRIKSRQRMHATVSFLTPQIVKLSFHDKICNFQFTAYVTNI